jgi:hypothetical protein
MIHYIGMAIGWSSTAPLETATATKLVLAVENKSTEIKGREMVAG